MLNYLGNVEPETAIELRVRSVVLCRYCATNSINTRSTVSGLTF